MLPPPCFKDGIGQVMSCAWFHLDMMLHQTREFCFSWSFRCLLANSRRAVMSLLLRSGFCLATLPYRPDWWSAAEMVVLLEGSPLFTVQRWSSVRVTMGFFVTSLTKALLPQSLSLAGRPADWTWFGKAHTVYIRSHSWQCMSEHKFFLELPARPNWAIGGEGP